MQHKRPYLVLNICSWDRHEKLTPLDFCKQKLSLDIAHLSSRQLDTGDRVSFTILAITFNAPFS